MNPRAPLLVWVVGSANLKHPVLLSLLFSRQPTASSSDTNVYLWKAYRFHNNSLRMSRLRYINLLNLRGLSWVLSDLWRRQVVRCPDAGQPQNAKTNKQTMIIIISGKCAIDWWEVVSLCQALVQCFVCMCEIIRSACWSAGRQWQSKCPLDCRWLSQNLTPLAASTQGEFYHCAKICCEWRDSVYSSPYTHQSKCQIFLSHNSSQFFGHIYYHII